MSGWVDLSISPFQAMLLAETTLLQSEDIEMMTQLEAMDHLQAAKWLNSLGGTLCPQVLSSCGEIYYPFPTQAAERPCRR